MSEQHTYSSATTNCEACNIDHRIKIGAIEGVKQMPRHTCGIDGPNPNMDDLKKKYKKVEKDKDIPEPDPNEKYNAEVRRIAEVLGNIYLNFPVFKDREDTPHFNNFVERTIISFLPYARAMVAEMAKEFKCAYLLSYGLLVADERLNSIMIERGLIPSPENKQNDIHS